MAAPAALRCDVAVLGQRGQQLVGVALVAAFCTPAGRDLIDGVCMVHP